MDSFVLAQISVNPFVMLFIFTRFLSITAVSVITGLIVLWAIEAPRWIASNSEKEQQLGDIFHKIANRFFEFLLWSSIAEALAAAMQTENNINGLFQIPLLGSILFRSVPGQFLVFRIVFCALAVFTSSSLKLQANNVKQQIIFLVADALLLISLVYSGAEPMDEPTLLLFLGIGVWLGSILALRYIRQESPELLRHEIKVSNSLLIAAIFSSAAYLFFAGSLNAALTIQGNPLLLQAIIWIGVLLYPISLYSVFAARKNFNKPAAATIAPKPETKDVKLFGPAIRDSYISLGLIFCLADGAYATHPANFANALNNSAGTNITQTAATAFTTSLPIGGYTAELTVSPAKMGYNTFTVSLKDASGKAASNVKVSLSLQMKEMNMGTLTQSMNSGAAGTYTITAPIVMVGHWIITIHVVSSSVNASSTVVMYVGS